MQNKKLWTSYMLQAWSRASREYIEQIGRGPARSFWQVSPAQPSTIVKLYIISPQMALASAIFLGLTLIILLMLLLTIGIGFFILISSCILHCRINWRIPEPIKEGKEELVKY